MDTPVIQILSDAISEVGAWQWWCAEENMFQLEFCDVLLYDETKAEKKRHTSKIALRFYEHSFAIFLDNLDDEDDKKWYERFQADEIDCFPLDFEEFAFDDVDYAKSLLHAFQHRTAMQQNDGDRQIETAKHVLAARCDDVGFIVGGDRIEVIGNKGELSEEDIVAAAVRWWEYWRDYWIKRDTEEAYDQDYACEITIPADPENPIGRFSQE